jgi:hypothetical protein
VVPIDIRGNSCRRADFVRASRVPAPVVAVLAASPAVAQHLYLKDGDRVVFSGDSITEQSG